MYLITCVVLYHARYHVPMYLHQPESDYHTRPYLVHGPDRPPCTRSASRIDRDKILVPKAMYVLLDEKSNYDNEQTLYLLVNSEFKMVTTEITVSAIFYCFMSIRSLLIGYKILL